ncbi:glyoxylase-like metal-dependent hydrolase (beta-lactamase superfamily II) [Lipingzhangella halophila]|uniref:Glyoxylase-like metal-dependent hydrolase (Beta-lactamase superfamily II) n=1 Tax=Lipingzhangella halophila TaxID=1783352 RepID=A0A7W7RC73_9ACTN|nr:MBL fold metallo-hydrolase [Lipingzhangella halophila]MBB4929254.1 glyoxylase-like metal-dependent hydrolase (beta-lactamase superfamily II) [Lipingzhangella halophila]
MRPPMRRLAEGQGGFRESGELVCHCLLIETNEALVLVDTGLGTHALQDPRQRLGRRFMGTRPVLDPAETAAAQVRALGFDPADVRHIVLTHLDIDHSSGLADFPDALVHVHGPELRAATSGTRLQRRRYIPWAWEHGPQWRVHEFDGGERWFGFDSVRPLSGLQADIALIPLAGHTTGHVGVAIQPGGPEQGWLLHAGDAFLHRGRLDPRARVPAGMAFFETLSQTNGVLRRHNQRMLRRLRHMHGSEVEVFCAHDAAQFRALAPKPA